MPNANDLSPRFTPTRYITADVPPIGGVLKQRPEDFVVEEIPLYDPSGEGEHVYMMVEKRGLTAIDMLNIIAKHFRVPRHRVGYAGLKDKVAITRQVVSVQMPGRNLDDIPSLQHPAVSILWIDRHNNKLRRGHLAGNRFSIRIRGVEMAQAVNAQRAMRTLERVGVPDRVGQQRFGFLQNNHLVGRALFVQDFKAAVDELLGPPTLIPMPDDQRESRDLYAAGDFAGALAATPRWLRTERAVLEALVSGDTPEQAITAIDGGVLSYYFSAFQSAVFNTALDMRIGAGLLDALLVGDIAVRSGSRKFFAVDEPILADPAVHNDLKAVDISATGPMWGTRMQRTSGRQDAIDTDALAAFGLRPADLDRVEAMDAEMTGGVRRPFRVPLRNIEVEGGTDEHGPYIRCAFDLPRGAFATTVMAEIMKTPTTDEDAQTPGED
jgi:tRNA pseudouridine13 synthase